MLPSAVPAPDTRLFNRATMSAAVLALAIFVIDAVTPRGSGVGLLYVLPLLVGTFGGPPRFQYLAAFVVSLLAIVGLMVAPSGAPGILPYTIRTIALLVIWTTAIVLARFRRTWVELQMLAQNLQTRTKDLADVNFALDQSAIVATTDTKGRITYVNQKFCEVSKVLT